MHFTVGHLDTSVYHEYTREAGFPLWTMGVCVRGEMVVTRNGREQVIRPGAVNVVRPKVPYTVRSAPGVRRHEEYFSILAMPAEWERWLQRWHEVKDGSWTVETPPEVTREVVATFAFAYQASVGRRPMAQALIANALERVLILGSECVPAHSVGDPRIERAIEHASKNLASRLNVEALAEVAGMSASRFAHLFTEMHAQSPMRFVEAMRMDRARTLLLASDQPIKSIARTVGFQSPFHFADRFRVRVGQSPSEYRRNPS